MAIIKCPECGKDVSDAAANCPNCGFPIRKEEPRKNNKPLIIIGIVLVIAILAVGVFVVVAGKTSLTDGISIGGVIGNKETEVVLTPMTFLDYFTVDIQCGQATPDDESHYKIEGVSFDTYHMSCDMTVTIKPKMPLRCENVYVSIDTGINKDYNFKTEGTDLRSLHLAEDGYYTGTHKLTFTSPIYIRDVYFFEDKMNIYDASGSVFIQEE